MVAEGHPVGQQIRSGLPESPPKTPASYHRYAAFAGNTTNSRSTDLSARTASTGLIGGSLAIRLVQESHSGDGAPAGPVPLQSASQVFEKDLILHFDTPRSPQESWDR